MPHMQKAICILLLIVQLAACATVGRDFKRSQGDSFIRQQTSMTDVAAVYGTPHAASETKLSNGQKMNTLAYVYAKGVMGSAQARSLTFVFVDGLLIGDTFCSSFAEDSTGFPFERAGEIKDGSTTISEAQKILGPSAGNGFDVETKRQTRMWNQIAKVQGRMRSQVVVVWLSDDGVVQKSLVQDNLSN